MLSASIPASPLEMPPLPVLTAPTSLPSARSPCASAQGDRPMSVVHLRSPNGVIFFTAPMSADNTAICEIAGGHRPPLQKELVVKSLLKLAVAALIGAGLTAAQSASQ